MYSGPLPLAAQDLAPKILAPDLDQSRRMLAILDPEPGAQFGFRACADQTTDIIETRKCFGTLDHGIRQSNSEKTNGRPCRPAGILEERQRSVGAGVYVVPNKLDGKGQRLENVIGPRALFVDADNEAQVRSALAFAKLIPPGLSVASGGLDGDVEKLQLFWPVEGCPVDEFTEAQLLLISRAGGDPAVKDACRLMRLAGYYHLKHGPRMTRIISADPSIRYNYPDLISRIRSLPQICDPPASGGRRVTTTAVAAGSNDSSRSNVFLLPIPGVKPALFANRKSLLNAAAQAGVSPQFEPRTYSFERIAEECPQVKQSLATGGKDDSEPVWYLGNVRLASFCHDGEHYAHEIGKLHPKYTPADTDARFQRAIADDIGAPLCESYNTNRPGVCQTCPHFGKIKSPIVLGGEEAKNNWFGKLKRSDKGKILPVLANAIIAFREAPEWQGKLWYDEFQLKTVIRGVLPFTHLPGNDWSDDHDVCATEWLQNKGIMVRPDVAGQAAEKVARERPFNPLQEYLDGLAWDGTPRLDTWPINYLGAKDTPYHRAVGAKAMIAAVARPYDPGCQCRNVLILEGPQDLGKSKAARKLSEPFFTDDVTSLGTKDAAMQISGAWIAELAELSALTRAEVNAAKAFASRQTDRFRPPYGRRVDTFPRQGVLWGTSNNDQYLRDETGGTRWWPIRCTFIDIPGLTAARDQLWAEAVHRYRAGEKWWIDDPKLLKAAKAEQDARYQADAWQELVEAYCAGKQSVTVGDILGGAIHKLMTDWTRGDEMRISNILVRLGWGRAFITRTPGAKQQWRYVEPGHGSHPNRQRRRKANRR